MDIDTTIRQEIAHALQRGSTIAAICTAADVPYFTVYNWLKRRNQTVTLDVVVAERIYTALTGKRFTD